ncbi:hypothetical protein IV417_08815 [Alphaproteobacteria bacterium KMM 3653]|uniref:Uncharacterized protein n=1 Tax=Harenicola maris TaxID=2841044 RepID=A0AAP2CN57_9RHOB|nr:hypothetical protein [Harenicola maris]
MSKTAMNTMITKLKFGANVLMATSLVAVAGGYFLMGGQSASAASFLFTAPTPAWETASVPATDMTMAQRIGQEALVRAQTARTLASNETHGAGKLAQLAAQN